MNLGVETQTDVDGFLTEPLFAGRGANPEESSEENPQQAVRSGQPPEEEGVHRRTGEQVHVLTE